MGLNFHVHCKSHKVVGMIAKGEEGEILHHFYRAHNDCRKNDPTTVEVEADGYSEQGWMSNPLPERYTDLGLLDQSNTYKIYQQISGDVLCHDLAATVFCRKCAPRRPE